MKNKYLLSFSVALLSLPLFANAANPTLSCPFTDFFPIKGAGVEILEKPAPYVLGHLTAEIESPTYFNLQCGDSNVYGGDLYVDVGLDDNNKCSLVIHDGPFTSPTVHASCKGIVNYRGMDSTVSHNYNLNFSN